MSGFQPLVSVLLQSVQSNREISLVVLQVAAFLLPALVLLIQFGMEHTGADVRRFPIFRGQRLNRLSIFSPAKLGVTAIVLVALAALLSALNVLGGAIGLAFLPSTLPFFTALSIVLIMCAFLIIALMSSLVYETSFRRRQIDETKQDVVEKYRNDSSKLGVDEREALEEIRDHDPELYRELRDEIRNEAELVQAAEIFRARRNIERRESRERDTE